MAATNTTNTAIAGGVHAPPAFQTEPSALKRIMAVYLEQDHAAGAMVAHMYTMRHADPRKIPPLAPDHMQYTARVGDTGTTGNMLVAIIGAALALECGAIWILETPAARDICAAAALELITAAEAPGFPWLAHELSAGKHATELAGLIIQRRREDTGRGQGIPVGVYFVWVGEVWPALPVLSGYKRLVTNAPAATPALRETIAAMWLDGVTLAAYALGAQLRFSPSYTGMVTLRQVIAAKEQRAGRALERLEPERRAEVEAARPTYLQWRSSFLEHDLSPYWAYHTGVDNANVYIPVYLYDRNWSFVTATREVPVGNPVATSSFVKSDPGFYHLLSATPPDGWPTTRPGPFHTGERAGAWPGAAVYDVWAWEAQIRQALAQGWHVEVEYGWYWPTRTDLRPWQQRLWAARLEARRMQTDTEAGRGLIAGSAALAEGIIKRVGVASVGRLAQRGGRAVMRSSRAREVGATILSRHVDDSGMLTGFSDVATQELARDDMSRPEWWATIISNANERTLAAIYTYAPDDTILAYVDGIATLEPHSELDGPADKIGGWRSKGVAYLPVTELERLDTLSAYELVKAIGRYGATHAPAQAEGWLDDGAM